jgi:hypothetical protein
MANIQAPYGFRHIGFLGGYAPNFANASKLVSASNGTAIYAGDPVTQLNTGYIAKSTAGTTQIHGIFIGCEYFSTSRGYTWRSPYWPGSDATGDVTAWVIHHPEALFQVQAGGAATAIALSNVGNNANFGAGTGNTATGQSGAYLDQTTVNTTSTLPFRIIGLVTDPPGFNGTDTTTGYNDVVVAFNWQDFKSTTGI